MTDQRSLDALDALARHLESPLSKQELDRLLEAAEAAWAVAEAALAAAEAVAEEAEEAKASVWAAAEAAWAVAEAVVEAATAARAARAARAAAEVAWGIVTVRNLRNVERHGPRVTQITPVDTPATIDAADPDPLDDLAAEDPSLPGQPANTFLRNHVRRDGDLDGPAIEVAAAVSSRAVTVVNFWATWCVPCKEEFSGFQTMFVNNRRDTSWGNETRFVPILVDDAENARSAYATWKTSMPDIHMALVDQQLDQNGVRGGLGPTKLLVDQPEALPVTLLFDCRRRIRWLKIGALDQANFNALANEIDKLRAELRQDTCKKKRSSPSNQSSQSAPSVTNPPPVSAVVDPFDTPVDNRKTSTCNRNGRCDARFEDCKLCPGECACNSGEKCSPRPGQLAICKKSI